jgi:hypothetical protein
MVEVGAMGISKIFIWPSVFISFLILLGINSDLWPLVFIVPVFLIVAIAIYSFIFGYCLYNENTNSSRLIGRISYGIDKNGKPTKKVHYD